MNEDTTGVVTLAFWGLGRGGVAHVRAKTIPDAVAKFCGARPLYNVIAAFAGRHVNRFPSAVEAIEL